MTRTLTPLISIVDDDESVRESLPDLIRTLGYSANAFSSAEEFLGSSSIGKTQCLILDITMPGMTGPELQEELKLQQRNIPIVFITAHAEGVNLPTLIDNGAVDCLLKPFSESELLRAVEKALERSAN